MKREDIWKLKAYYERDVRACWKIQNETQREKLLLNLFV